jgi:16S rRNA (cytosine1402-N4)-methyltransferase
MSYRHVSVLRDEAVSMLNCAPGKTMVDCTLGGAGHAAAILEKILPDGMLLGIDQDIAAIENARQVLMPYSSNIYLFHENFVNLPSVLSRIGINAVDGILVDLGLSLYQIKSSGRGFTFSEDQPLDMRMNTNSSITAAHIINEWSQAELTRIFREYGEERFAKRIAERIVQRRQRAEIVGTGELVGIITDVIPKGLAAKSRIHPATRVFMALRIAVNQELEVLEGFLEKAVDLLNPHGRICIIAFHSLEDRIVKYRFRELAETCRCPKGFPICVCTHEPKLKLITRKPIRPSVAEVELNPMSRSAVLRVAEKLPDTGRAKKI